MSGMDQTVVGREENRSGQFGLMEKSSRAECACEVNCVVGAERITHHQITGSIDRSVRHFYQPLFKLAVILEGFKRGTIDTLGNQFLAQPPCQRARDLYNQETRRCEQMLRTRSSYFTNPRAARLVDVAFGDCARIKVVDAQSR